MPEKLLIADDEASIRYILIELFNEEYQVDTASDGDEVLSKLEDSYYDLLLLDLRMPKQSGLEVLQKLKEQKIRIQTIVITADRDAETAIEAMKLGIFDYITKPFDTRKLRILVKNALDHRSLEQQVERLQKEVTHKYQFKNIIGNSKAVQMMFAIMNQVIDNDVTVLITGESGSGKELVARSIHYNSPRKDKPFITVDCASIPENLMENELFGHEKGSYTGAHAKQEGKFETANQGTIFLDEIGDLPLDLQAKLLRVLQEREFTRIGGTDCIKVNVRVIAATNANLEKKVEAHLFRADLYYRLNVIPIKIPPLRERPEDIPLLCHHFLAKYNREFSKAVNLDANILFILQRYSWKGNIRELENVIQRLVIMSQNGIADSSYLPQEILQADTPNDALPIGYTLSELEKKYILKCLDLNEWNISKTAGQLGISRKTMHNKLSQYGLKRK